MRRRMGKARQKKVRFLPLGLSTCIGLAQLDKIGGLRETADASALL